LFLQKFNLILDRQITADNNTLISNDTFAFDNSLCESNDDQPIINTQQKRPPPPIPPRAPRTLNGNNKSSSPS